MQPNQTAVLLLAHGTPDNIEDIPQYLRNVTGGRPVSGEVLAAVTHRYSLIGRSPLTAITLRQADLLRQMLAMPVYVGMRNWHPYIADTVRNMRDADIKQVIAVCMAPQNSRTSVGLYKRAAFAEAGDQIEMQFVESWHDHPLLVKAFAEKLKPVFEVASAKPGANPTVIFTAHSVPEHTIADGDPYEQQARNTAELVARELGLSQSDRRFAFQSQGMSGGPWIGPTVEETISALKQEGHKGVVMQAVGFVCDHVEVLYDIDIGFRKFAAEQGMELWRAESLNDSGTLIAALADLVRSRLKNFSKDPIRAVRA